MSILAKVKRFIEGVVDEVIALSVIAVTEALLWLKAPIPEWWRDVVLLIVGFYFGAKTVRKSQNQT